MDDDVKDEDAKSLKLAICDAMLWARDGNGPPDDYVLDAVQKHIKRSNALSQIAVMLGLRAAAPVNEIIQKIEDYT